MGLLKETTLGHRTKAELVLRAKKIKEQQKNPHLYVTAQYKYRKLNPLKYLYRLAKRRAIVRGHEFNITHEDLSMPEYCPLLGIKLDQEHPNLDFHYSLDRIDSTKGYIKGNVMIISHRANRLKNNATSKELRLLADNLAKYEENVL